MARWQYPRVVRTLKQHQRYPKASLLLDSSLTKEVEEATIMNEQAKLFNGVKFDEEKLRWSLIPWEALEEVVKVLEIGAKKYGDFNWQTVERTRYLDALQRHYVALMKGQTYDEESHIHHSAHIVCNALFIMWIDRKMEKEALHGD